MNSNTTENLADASLYPTLTALLPEQMAALERVAAKGQAGKHKGDPGTSQGADYHVTKSDGHIVQAGAFLNKIDEETGEPHIILAALRLLFTDLCARHGEPNDA